MIRTALWESTFLQVSLLLDTPRKGACPAEGPTRSNRSALRPTGSWFLVFTPPVLGCATLGKSLCPSEPHGKLRGNDVWLVPHFPANCFTPQKVPISFSSNPTRLAIPHLCGQIHIHAHNAGMGDHGPVPLFSARGEVGADRREDDGEGTCDSWEPAYLHGLQTWVTLAQAGKHWRLTEIIAQLLPALGPAARQIKSHMISMQASFILKAQGPIAQGCGGRGASHTLTWVPRTLHLTTGKTEVGTADRKMWGETRHRNQLQKMSFCHENPTV